ncbi:MAG: hypothetical protein HC886_03610 [Leptolyngbyaceae cyanobacterium SM1_1_3]|nr:hypothetical protein [Leptolyngbyaceae cyanobacterium SM1_1_3]NJN02939.1 hypothetical protein [Leptolyngbyaceae cyanobacterium RM1_1_2]
MSSAITTVQRKSYLAGSTLVLLAFATAFFSRILDSAGAPSAINFLHFLVIPVFCGQVILTAKGLSRYQRVLATKLYLGLGLLLAVMLVSAIVNDAGLANVIIDFLLLGEPFILLITTASLPVTVELIQKFRTWLVGFFLTNIAFAYAQYVLFMILKMHPKAGNPDYVQGVFYHSGAGHVVSASVSLTFGAYYFVNARALPIWLRAIVFLGAFWHMLMADAKQVLLSFLVAGVCLLITKLKSIGEAVKYLLGSVILCAVLWWCIQNVPAFAAFNTWARPEIYGADGEATLLKSAALRIIPTYYESPLNWFFGLGPGHTVGRLGGWMISGYWSLLEPLGATMHPVPNQVWAAVGQSWLGDQSSMFSPLFGWAGIWGDLGWLGIAAYLYLAVITLQHFCLDDLSKFFVFSVGAFGLVFSQMEEPGYMLSITMIVGILWQEHRLRKVNPAAAVQLNQTTFNLKRPKQVLQSILLAKQSR